MPPCPWPLRYLLDWYHELAAARPQSGFGVSPLAYGELDAWARLTGRDPRPLEVAWLRRLDAAFLRVVRAAKDAGAEDDGDDADGDDEG